MASTADHENEENEWLPDIKIGLSIPHRMRRRDRKTGEWVYRDATEEDIEDYLAGEAW